MPAREIPFRFAEQAQRLRGRVGDAGRRPAAGSRHDTGLGALLLDWSADPAVRLFWQNQARDVAAGSVRAFGVACPTSPDGVPDWSVDALTGYRWPDRYCFDVAPRAGDADAKHVWQLSRLQYLLPVAAHAAVSGDRNAAELCARHLRRWLDDNPPRRGVLWRSGIELAIRSLSMVLVLELLARTAARSPELERAVARSVREHGDWIRRFPSRYSSANNHRVAELAGLLIIAAAYPTGGFTDQVDATWRDLDEEIRRQIHPDGVPGEQSTAYGALVLEWLALCAALGPGLGRRFSTESARRITAAAGFLNTLTDQAGGTVRVGDDDESRLLTTVLPTAGHPRAVVRLVERTMRTVVAPGRVGVSCFAPGGYTVARSMEPGGEALWVLDHGPLGLGDLAAHAHADTLAVYLHYRGRPVFVDAGTFRYGGAGPWRDRLRGTALHNTVTVGDADSSVMTGAFNWDRRRRAQGRLIDVQPTAAGFRVAAEHDGYLAGHGVIHRRTLTAIGAGRFRLSDGIAGVARPAAAWSLLVAAGLEVRDTGRGWLVCEGDVPLVRVDVPAAGWSRSVARGRSQPALGWYAPSFGRLVPTAQLLLHGRLDPEQSLDVDITLLQPSDGTATGDGGRQ